MQKFREIYRSHSNKTPRQIAATAWGVTSITAEDWHLKAKDREYYVGLIKIIASVSMRKIS